MHRYLCLFLFVLCCACSQQGHHQEASTELMTEIRSGLAQTLLQRGEEADLDQRHSRNLIYELALHAQDEPGKLQQIRSAQSDLSHQVKHYATTSMRIVQEQRPGYPVPDIFETLLTSETLSREQQILLLASSRRLIAQSGAVINKDSAGGR